MAKISNKQYAEALYEITKNTTGVVLTSVIEAFVKLLVQHHKLKQAEHIITEFKQRVKKESGIISLHITSARELDLNIVENIKKVFGKKVEAVIDIDNNLIGGIKVQLEDKILDASLKTQLKLLKKQLAN